MQNLEVVLENINIIPIPYPYISVNNLVTTIVIATPIKVNMVITNFSPIKIWPLNIVELVTFQWE